MSPYLIASSNKRAEGVITNNQTGRGSGHYCLCGGSIDDPIEDLEQMKFIILSKF